MDSFDYFMDKSGFDCIASKCLFVKGEIEKREDLFECYASGLNFPDYFGRNWDALYDLLTDLSWAAFKHITIIHEDIPIKSEEDKKIYIQLLYDVLEKSNGEFEVKIKIMFPQETRSEIENILNLPGDL